MYINLDLCRFLFLLTSLVLYHIKSNIMSNKFLYDYIRYLNYLFQILSVLYLCLCALRKGHVDYKSKEPINFSTRYCRPCQGYKPIRAHHCSRCNRCIKKMDHHCMWLNVCVNYDNHGDFIRFLFFSILSTSISLFGNIVLIFKEILSNLQKVLLAYLILFSFLVSLFCGIMLKIQIGLVIRNTTFIEDQHYYIYEERSVYDRGLYNNWCEVMGSAYLLWMCKPNGNGMNYTRNDGLENDDINFV